MGTGNTQKYRANWDRLPCVVEKNAKAYCHVSMNFQSFQPFPLLDPLLGRKATVRAFPLYQDIFAPR